MSKKKKSMSKHSNKFLASVSYQEKHVLSAPGTGALIRVKQSTPP